MIQRRNKMKNTVFFIFIAVLLFAGCKKQIKKDKPVNNNSVIENNNSNNIVKKYEKEGFIDKNTFAVIIVRPLNSRPRKDEIENQAKKRAFVMLQKYVMNDGKRLKKNDKVVIQNAINNSSECKKVQDTEKSRDIYVLVIKEDGFYRKIKSLGI